MMTHKKSAKTTREKKLKFLQAVAQTLRTIDELDLWEEYNEIEVKALEKLMKLE